MASVNKVVDIDGETFALDEIPRVGTALVEHAKDALLGIVDLKGLVTDLSKLGSFMRVAYNGVAGHTELQIKVRDVGCKIAELADKSAVTVNSFKSTSEEVLQKLQGINEYLLNGLEDMALVNLSGLSELAERMAKASAELLVEFETARDDVKGALNATAKAESSKQEKKMKLENQQEEFEKELKKDKQLKLEADEAERWAEMLFDEAQKREDKAYDDHGSLLTTLVDAVAKVFNASVSAASLDPQKVLKHMSEIGDKTFYKEAMDKAREEKMKHLEAKLKIQEIRREANQQCIEFAERIKNCRRDDELAQVAIDALHKSVGALNSLFVIMSNAVQFWKVMQIHCQALAGEDIKIQIATAVERYDKTKRLEIWTRSAFKKKAINYYAKWVALGEVCGTYMQQIRQTRADLYKYLEENPTIEQSRRNLRDMATTFITEMREEQNDIDEENRKTAQEITKLKQ